MLFEPNFLANARRMAWAIAARVLPPPPPLDYLAWAKEHVRFGNESQYPGRYNERLFPYFTPIFEALGPEHPCRVVVVKKSAQLGGTVLAQIFIAASLALDPGPVLYVHPTEGNAGRWAKTKWRVMIRQIDALKRLFKDGNSREPGASLLYQERRDGLGSLTISGANSEASLSMISMPRQVQDDLSKWEANRAGDPEVQADSRSMAFLWGKVLKISTPLMEDSCKITKAYLRGNRVKLHVACPHCGHRHALEWENLEPNLKPDAPQDACFNCPDCGGLIDEVLRRDMVRDLIAVAERPEITSTYSIEIWSAYSPLVTLAQISEAWFKVKGDPAGEQGFFNDWLGRPYKGAGDAPDWEALVERGKASHYRRGRIPRGGLYLCIGVDCQDDRVEAQVVAFGRDLRRFVVDYIVIAGHISESGTRKKLDTLLAAEWPDSFGRKRACDLLAIDGNAFTEDVFDWVKRHPASKVIMVRGIKSDAAPPLTRVRRERKRDGTPIKYSKRFFNMGASPMKTALYGSLKKTDPLERAFIAFPQGLDNEYFEQLCSERRKPIKVKGGGVEYRWVKPDGQNNEALDNMLQAEAAAFRLGWRTNSDAIWDRVEAEIEKPAPEIQGDLEDLLTAPQTAAGSIPPAADKPREDKQSAAARRRALLD